MGHRPCTGGRCLHSLNPQTLPRQGGGIWSFRLQDYRICAPAEEATFPPPPGRLTLTTPLQQGLNSRLRELYLGSVKGDFSKRQQNKGSAPQGNRGERARLMHAH